MILAHPFDGRFQIPPRMIADWGVDAVETVNLHSRDPSKEELHQLSLLRMTCVAGADAHHPGDRFSGALMLVPGWVESERDLVRCLLARDLLIKAPSDSDGP